MNTIEFESSQYVAVEFTIATVAQRLLAAVIDMVVFGVYFIVASFFWIYFLERQVAHSEFMEVIGLFLVRLPWLAYNPVCEFFFGGQTIGKYIMGIRVVTMHGDRLSLKEVATRWIFKGDFLWLGNSPFFFLLWFLMGFIALFTIGWSAYRQRLADYLANTVVVQVRNNKAHRLNDVLTIRNRGNHTVRYPQVVRFTDEDMILVKNTLARMYHKPNATMLKFHDQLCFKIAEMLEVELTTPMKDKFLEQVLQDYVVLTR